MRKDNSDFNTAFVSESGSYLDNRDYFAFMETDDMACYVLADGLDSDQELRSAEMAVKTVLENFMEKPSMSKRRLMRDVREAQEWLQFESRRVRLKASLLIVVTNYSKMIYLTCGNVRLYHFRGGRLNFRSKDHSLAQSMADDGRIPDEATSNHEERGNLLEYVGKPGGAQVQFFKKMPLADGDILLLATPGLWEGVELAEMLDVVEESKDPAMLTDTLEEVLLSKQRPVYNNYTAAAIFANKVFQEKPKNLKKWIKRILIALLVLLITGTSAYIVLARMAAQKAAALEDMIESSQQGDDYAKTGDYLKAVKSYSEARNAAIKIKDTIHKRLYTNEQKISQQMVDGDEYVSKGDFEMAKASYEKAHKNAGLYPPFQVKDIEDKIDKLGIYAQVASWMKDGDLKFQGGEYANALKLYQKANKSATDSGYAAAQKELQTKLTDTNDKMAAIQQEVKEIQAGKLEARGDRLLKDLDYEGAMDAYSSAQEIYQEIGKLESVLALERSITKAQDKQSTDQQKSASGQLPEALDADSDGESALSNPPTGQTTPATASLPNQAAKPATNSVANTGSHAKNTVVDSSKENHSSSNEQATKEQTDTASSGTGSSE